MKVHYHQDNRPPLELTVLNQNKDGTIDIGPEKGEPVVTSCKLLDAPVSGCATAIGVAKPADEKKK